MTETTQPFKVTGQTNPNALAGAIAGEVRLSGRCEMQAIGAAAVNQLIKAVGIARGHVAPNGIDLVAIPSFLNVMIEDREITAIRIVAEGRR